MSIDIFLTLFLNSLIGKSDIFDQIVFVFAQWMILVFFAALVLLPFTAKPKKRVNRYYLLINTIVVGITLVMVNVIIGTFAYRARPFIVYNTVSVISTFGLDNAFPSVHAMLSFLVATIFFFTYRKIGIVFLMLASMVALSRVIGGVHFLSDVVAGGTLGMIGAYGINRFFVQKIT